MNKSSNTLSLNQTHGDLVPAVVTDVDAKSAKIWVKNCCEGFIEWQGMNWARKFLTDNRQGPAPSRQRDSCGW